MAVIFAHSIFIASALPSSASALESAISALEREITTLESSSGWWERSLPWFTALVVLGLVVDLVVIIWERLDEVAERHRWVSLGLHFPDEPTRLKFVLELFATSAIFLGVAGEFWAGVKIAYINGQLRTKNAELRTDSDKLVELLRRNTEEEQMARVEAEESTAWRRLTPEDRQTIRSELRRFAVKRTWFQYNNNDVEAFNFGHDVASSMPASWNPTEPMPVQALREGPVPLGKYGPLERGILIGVVRGDKSYENAANTLTALLSSFGFDCKRSDDAGVKASEYAPMIVVFIEPRPEGRQGEAKLRRRSQKKAD